MGRESLKGNETVLLVEDDDAVRTVLRLALLRFGYIVLAAGGAAEALEIIRRHSGLIHLLVTDVRMPGTGGPELAARARALLPGIRVLFLTGDASGVKWPSGQTDPDAVILEKPVSAEELARKLREILDR